MRPAPSKKGGASGGASGGAGHSTPRAASPPLVSWAHTPGTGGGGYATPRVSPPGSVSAPVTAATAGPTRDAPKTPQRTSQLVASSRLEGGSVSFAARTGGSVSFAAPGFAQADSMGDVTTSRHSSGSPSPGRSVQTVLPTAVVVPPRVATTSRPGTRTATPSSRAPSPVPLVTSSVWPVGPSRLAGRSSPTPPPGQLSQAAAAPRSVTPVSAQIGWRATTPNTRREITPPLSPRTTVSPRAFLPVTTVTPPATPQVPPRQISPPRSIPSSPRQTSPWRALTAVAPVAFTGRVRKASPPKSAIVIGETRYRPLSPADRTAKVIQAPQPSTLPTRYTAAAPAQVKPMKVSDGLCFGSSVAGELRFTPLAAITGAKDAKEGVASRHRSPPRVTVADPATPVTASPKTVAPSTPVGFGNDDALLLVDRVAAAPVYQYSGTGGNGSSQQPNAAGQPEVRSQWDIAESRVWNVCQELLVLTEAAAGGSVDQQQLGQCPKELSSRAFISKVFLAPHGVLGTQLPLGATSRSYGLVFKASEPGADVAILDPLPLDDIHNSPPIGVSGYLGPSAGGIYEWLGTQMDPAFPASVQMSIKKACDAKFYVYQDRCTCIHVAKPDFHEHPCSRKEAAAQLEMAYRNVLSEFAVSDARFLRLCPISEGLAAGVFTDILAEMTFEALCAAFAQLTPEEKVKVLNAERIEMCVFRESQLETFTVAWEACCSTRNASPNVSFELPDSPRSQKVSHGVSIDAGPRVSRSSSPESKSRAANLEARCQELERVLSARNADCHQLELEVQRLREQNARDEREREQRQSEMERRMDEKLELAQQLADRETAMTVERQRAEQLEREVQRLSSMQEELWSSSADRKRPPELGDIFGAQVSDERGDGTTGGSYTEVPTICADLFTETEGNDLPTLAALRSKLRARDSAASAAARGNTSSRSRRSPRGANSGTNSTASTNVSRRAPGSGTGNSDPQLSSKPRRPSSNGGATQEYRGWR